MRPPLSTRRHPVLAIASICHSSSESSRLKPPAIAKHATCHTLRHSFAMHLLEERQDPRTSLEPFGHQDVKTTMVYTHVLNRSR
jgi:site-specific recombinase XerD